MGRPAGPRKSNTIKEGGVGAAGRRGLLRRIMGLTIHYQLSLTVSSSLEGAATAVEKLRQTALDLPFKEVGRLRCFAGEECDFERWRGTDWVWPLIQARRWLNLGNDGRGNWVMSVGVTPVEVVVFQAWPGERCEPMSVGLARYPSSVELSADTRCELYRRTGRKYPRRVSTAGLGRGWSWKAFCKTQYASNVSAAHFLRCHATVCALLREAQRLGFRVQVYDEGHFWGKWKYDALAREVEAWNHFTAGFVRAVEKALGDSGAVMGAPITGNPAYYKAAGIEPETVRMLAELMQRFR